MGALLSVVIPVYNARRFIEETVESVMAQSYDNFEVILVDDGSTDNSGAICDALAAKYDRIRVIHKTNGGVSSARNAGIDAALGDYITFVDADDKIGDNMFADIMAECTSKNADKVFCGHDEVSRDGHHVACIASLPARRLLNRRDIVDKLLYTGCVGDSYMNSVGGGAYNVSILRKNGLRFEDRPMGEDWLFNMKYCNVIESAVYIDEPYYKYMRNDTSAVSRYQPRQFELWLENRDFRRALAAEHNYQIDTKAVDARWMTKVLFYTLQVINNDSNPSKKLQAIFTNPEFRSALSNATEIEPRYFEPIVWLLKKKFFIGAYLLLRVYALRLKY